MRAKAKDGALADSCKVHAIVYFDTGIPVGPFLCSRNFCYICVTCIHEIGWQYS